MKKLPEILSAVLKSLLLIIAVIILIKASSNLYIYNKERIANEKLAKNVVSEITVSERCPISVDFEKLHQENEDIIAWLYCKDTPINYPVVHGEDNSYYIHRNTLGEYSLSGTLFADCRNEVDFAENNTIIYGHNMKNNTMFGSLVKYQNQAYFHEHPTLYLLTPAKEYKVELIAGMTTDSNSSIYQLPLDDEHKEEFVSRIMERSTFQSGYTYSSDDRFVMFSTCSYTYNDARYVLTGVLKEL